MGDSTITAAPTAAFVVGGQTAFPGGPAIVENGRTISIANRAIVVDGTTVSMSGGLPASTVVNVNGVPITASSEQVFTVGGQQLAAGGSAITVDGTTLSLAADGSTAVVNGQTESLQMATMDSSGNAYGGSQQAPGAEANIPLITLGSQTFTANAATQFSLAPGATLTPGGAVTFSGTTVSLAGDASQVVVNGQTEGLRAPMVTPAPAITMDGMVYAANAGSTYDIDGSMLTPGGVIMVSGSTISLASDASEIVVNGQTTTLSSGGSRTAPASNDATITAAPVLTVDGQTVQGNGQGPTYVISGETLTPGGAITFTNANGDVETLSLDSGASELVSIANGATQTVDLAGNNAGMATITAPPILTVDGQGYAANGGTSYIISGQTLTPGGAITITDANGDVETLSLDSAATELYSVVSGTTVSSMVGAAAAMSTGAPVLTVDGQQYTAVSYDSGSGATYVVDGQTLTRGGTITISGANGMETLSLDAAGTALVEIANGQTTTSSISGAYAVMPTAAPILTIDGETFTPINIGATYLIDGQTLTPGEQETVTISGNTFIVSLAPHASLLIIQTENAQGQVTATSFETLFPAPMTRGTVTNTVMMGATTRTSLSAGASSTSESNGVEPSLQNAAPTSSLQLAGLTVAIASFALAVLL